MKKSSLPIESFLLFLFLFLAVEVHAQEFSIDDNGIVKCEGAKPGDTANIFGDTYEAVDNNLLLKRRNEGADLSKVCTSLVTDMNSLFLTVSRFNQDISSWDVSSVTDMTGMFRGADRFNQNLGNWDVSAVTKMGSMFSNASSF